MIKKGIIKKGEYFDSVSLMIVAKEINKIDGVIDSAVVMGSPENLSILKNSDMYISDFDNCEETDLLICLKAENSKIIDGAFKETENIFNNLKNKVDESSDFVPKSIDGALKILKDANLALISINGKYAAKEAMNALQRDLHVMIFSDNVSIEDEVKLKTYAKEKGLLVMGPDCGTAIINGVPLAFANVVNKGNIGIVSASGTGLQEVSSIICDEGGGISQAIGTGGRDVKKEVGGIMFIEALKALNEDENTKIIVLISKPPHEEVLKKISDEIKKISKKVVGIFIGADEEIIRKSGAIPASTLEDAAMIAVGLSEGIDLETIEKTGLSEFEIIKKIAEEELENKKSNQKYLRGLFSGGTLCDEAQLIFKEKIGYTYSNTPLNPDFKLKDSLKSKENTIVDLGEDEFTKGRPHPMIDFSLRKKRILEEALNDDVAVILIDVVLGYGSNMKPADELIPVIMEVKEKSPTISIICSITGTESDPQSKTYVTNSLEKAGAIIMPTNASASKLAGEIINNIGGRK